MYRTYLYYMPEHGFRCGFLIFYIFIEAADTDFRLTNFHRYRTPYSLSMSQNTTKRRR